MSTTTERAGTYLLDCFGNDVIAAYSGRVFDNSQTASFFQACGIHSESAVFLKQVHSANLVRVTAKKVPGTETCADGMLTTEKERSLAIRTADCVPVFFYDPDKKAVAIVHAGWRGLSQGIVLKMVEAMRLNLRSQPGDIQVAIGPAIRKCCYEVGPEFEAYFPNFYQGPGKSKKHPLGKMDMIVVVKMELLSQGIREKHLFDSGICTVCQNDKFYSYRKENGTENRIISVISLKKSAAR